MSNEPLSPTPAVRVEAEPERQERCVRCQQLTSDWVDTEYSGGRVCRSCEKELRPVVPAPRQNELTEILDQVELRYKRSLADPYDPETCENALRDNPKLVKALRELWEAYSDKFKDKPAILEYSQTRFATLLREPTEGKS